jgi:hypothetical protein
MLVVDDSRPYRRPSEEEWGRLSPEEYPISDLILSQYHIGVVSLLAIQIFGDKYPPVKIVMHNGKAHLHDGHHRTLSEYVKGKKFIHALIAH